MMWLMKVQHEMVKCVTSGGHMDITERRKVQKTGNCYVWKKTLIVVKERLNWRNLIV